MLCCISDERKSIKANTSSRIVKNYKYEVLAHGICSGVFNFFTPIDLIKMQMSETSEIKSQSEKSHFSMCIDEIWGERLRRFLQQFLSGYADVAVSGAFGYKSVCAPDIYKLMCNGAFLGNCTYNGAYSVGCAMADFFNNVQEHESFPDYDISLYVETSNYDNIRNILEKDGHASMEFSHICNTTRVPFCEEIKDSKRCMKFRWYGKIPGRYTRCHINFTIHEMDNHLNVYLLYECYIRMFGNGVCFVNMIGSRIHDVHFTPQISDRYSYNFYGRYIRENILKGK